jgi:TnpA family transposase
MQIALSIQAGKILPSMLLQKPGVESWKNKLYQAFRELGRVVRTIFLLQYIGDNTMRRDIQGATTKVETYHNFCDWISFVEKLLPPVTGRTGKTYQIHDPGRQCRHAA